MAELFCREANRIDPPRVHRSRRCIGRATFAPSVKIVCGLLQHRENAPLIGQECASLPPGSADRTHRVACHGRRTASSIRSNLSFRYTHGRKAGREAAKKNGREAYEEASYRAYERAYERVLESLKK